MSRFVELITAILSEDAEFLESLLNTADQDELNSVLLRSIILSENPQIIDALVNAGACVNYQDKDGRTALFLAVKYNRPGLMNKLIELGCDVSLGKHNCSNALHLAARKGNIETAQILIRAGHPLDSVNWGGNTALLIACRFGHRAVVSSLISHGARVNICNKLGHYPLHYAAFAGDALLVRLLLTMDADPNVKTHLGITPIMLACERKHCSVVEYLAPRTNLHHREQLYGGTVMHWAIGSGCLPCVELLVSHDVDLQACDNSGRSPIVQAVQSNQPHILQFLLTHYKHTEFAYGSSNSCALHLASYHGYTDCLQKFLESPTTAHMKNNVDCFGDTPLDLAILAARNKTLGFLISEGAMSAKFPANVMLNLCEKLDPLSASRTMRCEMFEASYDSDTALPSYTTGSIQEEDQINKSRFVDATDFYFQEAQGLYPAFLPFKTYSPVKMAMIDMLKSASSEQMVAPVKFDFSKWLDKGPEAFVLKVTSLDLTDWIHQKMHSPWPLRELCRGCIRRVLGYRGSEKVKCLPVPDTMKDFLNMRELEEVQTEDIHIRSTRAFDDIDVE